MTFVLFLLYAAIGGGVGYGVFTLTDVGLPMSIAAGGITTALLGQIHLLASSGRATKDIDDRIDRVERTV
ncbi:MAG TPA: diguanylate phosphodiesterase, partial [Hyphomonas sp.]|nr:diguanylate phosphodiesterase [Hyphomonas sp.]